MLQVNVKYSDFINGTAKKIEYDLTENIRLILTQEDTTIKMEINDNNENSISEVIGYESLFNLVKGLNMFCNQINDQKSKN